MKTLLKSAAALGLVLAAVAAPAAMAQTAPAAATPATGPLVPGLAIANFDAAVANTDAFRAAAQQRPTTYKPVYDQTQVRARAIEAELKPLVDRFNADRAAKKPDAVLQPQYQAIQARQEAAKEEIQRMMLPIALSEAYVVEQIENRLDQAVRNAMTKRKISLVLNPQVVMAAQNGYDLTPTVTAELNLLIPTAQLVPPAGWEPRQIREARAQQAAQAGGAPAPAAAGSAPVAPRPVAGPQPEGR